MFVSWVLFDGVFADDGFAEAFGHSGDFTRFIYEAADLGGRQIVEASGDVELGAQFAGRAFGDLEELSELLRASAFRALGNVGRNGKGRALDLRLEAGRLAAIKSFEHVDRQPAAALPNFKILETLVGHFLKT